MVTKLALEFEFVSGYNQKESCAASVELDTNSYAPTSLELYTTYHWCVDEVNSPNTWTGDVWEFTVVSGPAH